MSLTTAQMARRAGRVTASNVPAILGVDDFKSPRMAYDEITGRSSFEGNEMTALGDDMEEACAKAFTRATSKRLTRRGLNRGGKDTLILATLDYVAVDEDAPVECKARGIKNPWRIAAQFGESGTDQAPMRDIFQVTAQLIACPEAERAYISEIVGGLGHRWYVIPRNAELIGIIVAGVEKFVTDFLEPGIAPPPDYRDLGAIEAVARRADVEAPIPSDLFNLFAAAKDKEDEVQEEIGTLRARLLEAMRVGDNYADVGVCEAGRLTYRKCKDGERFDEKRFAAEQPQLWRQYITSKPGHRTLLLRPNKGDGQ